MTWASDFVYRIWLTCRRQVQQLQQFYKIIVIKRHIELIWENFQMSDMERRAVSLRQLSILLLMQHSNDIGQATRSGR